MKRYLAPVIIAFSIVVFVTLIWLVPKWQIQGKQLLPEQLVRAENDARDTLAKIVGGGFFLLTAYFTWRSVTASERNAETAQRGLALAASKHEVERVLAEQKQITDRFTAAIVNLGNDKMPVRLGGVYALERIARDSPNDYWAVIEVLSAYVRDTASLVPHDGSQLTNTPEERRPKFRELPETPDPLVMRADLQAILTVIGRRQPTINEGQIHLHQADLQRADLQNGNFRKVCLAHADLRKAKLTGSDFSGANLIAADLRGTDLRRVVGLVQGQIDEAFTDKTTRVPAPLVGPKNMA
ncbi:MAG TPA: pentapeptide repeat-containing protein [Pyrinomonadaceae bacterium]